MNALCARGRRCAACHLASEVLHVNLDLPIGTEHRVDIGPGWATGQTVRLVLTDVDLRVAGAAAGQLEVELAFEGVVHRLDQPVGPV